MAHVVDADDLIAISTKFPIQRVCKGQKKTHREIPGEVADANAIFPK